MFYIYIQISLYVNLLKYVCIYIYIFTNRNINISYIIYIYIEVLFLFGANHDECSPWPMHGRPYQYISGNMVSWQYPTQRAEVLVSGKCPISEIIVESLL